MPFPADKPAALAGDEYHAALDAFRFLLFLGILVSHSHLDLALTQGFNVVLVLYQVGWTGVQGFFVLSGYLIATRLLGELTQHGKLDTVRFYQGRLLKIFPVLLLVVGFTLFVATTLPVFTDSPAWNRLPSGETWSVAQRFGELSTFVFFVGNLGYALGWMTTVTPALLVCWTLCVEEQFYFCLPRLLSYLQRHHQASGGMASVVRQLARLAWGFIGLGLLARSGAFLAHEAGWVSMEAATRFSYTFSVCQFDAVAAGVLLACWRYGRARGYAPPQALGLPFAAILSAAALAIYLACITSTAWKYSLGLTVINFAYLWVIDAVVSQPAAPVSAPSHPLLWAASLGKNGYCLYLTHSLGLVAAASWIAPVATGSLGTAYLAYFLRLGLGGLLSIVSAYLLFKLVESPLRRRFTRNSAPTGELT